MKTEVIPVWVPFLFFFAVFFACFGAPNSSLVDYSPQNQPMEMTDVAIVDEEDNFEELICQQSQNSSGLRLEEIPRTSRAWSTVRPSLARYHLVPIS